ncbi:MAG: SoxR reducing system RseC family protein [Prevotellaceae bacterium]|jgi:sigma-E factor negative regulatory protein RseC|nr:SoxR reducing system RseC family protein [Prevotellaceae bacterium]
MNRNVSCTSRSGIVSEITTESIAVNIISESACSGCSAKGLCSAFERKEKIISVPNAGQNIQCGDKVNVMMKVSMGMKAVLLAYFMPVIIVTVMLLFLLEMGTGEFHAGIISLVSLAGYYLVIYRVREKLKKQFYFYIEKAD